MKSLNEYEEPLNENKYDTDIEKFNILDKSSEDITEKDIVGDEWDTKYEPGLYVVTRDGMGNSRGPVVGIYQADSKRHSKIKAALQKSEPEIFTTGFYGTEFIEKSELVKQIKEKEQELKILKKIHK